MLAAIPRPTRAVENRRPVLHTRPSRLLVHSILVLAAAALVGCASTPEAETSAAPQPGPPSEPRLLYEWYAGGGKTQFIAEEDGSNMLLITGDVAPGTEHVHSDWSPDGTRIAFEALQDSGPASVWTADADGNDAVEIATCATGGCLQVSYPSWSPDGGQLVVVEYSKVSDQDWGPSRLVLIDADGSNRREITSTADGTTAFYSPRWSPDGSRIALQFETYPDATESVIASSAIGIVDATAIGTAAITMITDPSLVAGHPDWHPDGELIVFDTYDLSGFQTIDQPSNLYTIAPDGSGLTQLTTTTLADRIRLGEPTWTPDGDRIAVAIGSVGAGNTLTNSELGYVDAASGELTRLRMSGAAPRLQPDDE